VQIDRRYDVKARDVEPTLLYPSTWDDPALQQEVFGPVLPVMPYRNLKEIVNIMKRKPKPLAAYIFSKDQAAIDFVLASLSFGGGCINQTNLHCWIDSLPFGRVGNSGMGKYYGKAGFDALSKHQSHADRQSRSRARCLPALCRQGHRDESQRVFMKGIMPCIC
jgi:aldehyde dehydrogenase (NAD+)